MTCGACDMFSMLPANSADLVVAAGGCRHSRAEVLAMPSPSRPPLLNTMP